MFDERAAIGVALYASDLPISGHRPDQRTLRALTAQGVQRLGGEDAVRADVEWLRGLNYMLMHGLLDEDAYERALTVRFLDEQRLARCLDYASTL